MSAYKSDFLRVLAERGFIHQVSDAEGLDAKAAAGPLTAYVGFDATAPSLHIGNLLTIMMLRWLQKTGHRPIALMGGGTSKIGDPSGKDTSRTLLTGAQIEANIASIRTVFSRFLDFDAGAMMADNAEWLDQLHYIPFLRDVGRHFTINKMLTFDSVKLRLEREQPLTFLEFNYMILQAYDFVELYKRHGCILQMGGSDQWGNIVNGIDLGRRLLNAGLFALTTPLLTTSSGSKMGKTETGAVWLNPNMTNPYDYWQFWRNCEDADVGRLLKLFTELPLDEIGRLAGLKGQELNEAKKVLATEATALLHGRAGAEQAAKTARRTFEEGALAETLPTVEIPRATFAAGLGVLDAAVHVGLVSSKGDARRQIKGGGLRVNDVAVTDEKMMLLPSDLTPEGVIKLSLGRKRHVLLRATSPRLGYGLQRENLFMTIVRGGGLVLLWAYAIVRNILDWLGRASLFDESEHTLSMVERGLNWLFSTPWWAASGLAVVATGLLFWPNLRDYFSGGSRPPVERDIAMPETPKVQITATSTNQSGGVTAGIYINQAPPPPTFQPIRQSSSVNADGTQTTAFLFEIVTQHPAREFTLSLNAEGLMQARVLPNRTGIFQSNYTQRDGDVFRTSIPNAFGEYTLTIQTRRPVGQVQLDYGFP